MIGAVKYSLLVAAALVLHAQTREEVPAPSNIRAAANSRIFADRRFVFQIKAPAQKVQVMPGGGANA